MEDTATSAGTPSYGVPMQVLYRQVDGQMVLLDLETERYYGLDEVGADILNRLTAQPLEAAITALTRDYEVDPDELRRDVHDLVEELLNAGLLERLDGSS